MKNLTLFALGLITLFSGKLLSQTDAIAPKPHKYYAFVGVANAMQFDIVTEDEYYNNYNVFDRDFSFGVGMKNIKGAGIEISYLRRDLWSQHKLSLGDMFPLGERTSFSSINYLQFRIFQQFELSEKFRLLPHAGYAIGFGRAPFDNNSGDTRERQHGDLTIHTTTTSYFADIKRSHYIIAGLDLNMTIYKSLDFYFRTSFTTGFQQINSQQKEYTVSNNDSGVIDIIHKGSFLNLEYGLKVNF